MGVPNASAPTVRTRVAITAPSSFLPFGILPSLRPAPSLPSPLPPARPPLLSLGPHRRGGAPWHTGRAWSAAHGRTERECANRQNESGHRRAVVLPPVWDPLSLLPAAPLLSLSARPRAGDARPGKLCNPSFLSQGILYKYSEPVHL